MSSAAFKPVSVLAFTWNVGNAMPDAAELEHWLPREGAGYDLIAIGTQENNFNQKKRSSNLVVTTATGGGAEELRTDSDALVEANDAAAKMAASGNNKKNYIDPAKRQASRNGMKKNKKGPVMKRLALKPVRGLQKKLEYFMGGDSSSSKAWPTKPFTHEWDCMCAERLGNQFCVAAHVVLWEMRLTVYCRKTLRGDVSGIATASVATGIGGVLGNKGGLVARLKIGPTTVAFCSCHLEAHEGAAHLAARNDDCREVLRETMGGKMGGGGRPLDVACAVDHLVWMGDLNYRIDLGAPPPAAATAVAAAAGGGGGSGDDGEGAAPPSAAAADPHSSHVQAVVELVEGQEWDALIAADQLQAAQRAGDAFVGFEEGAMAFAPTFKVQRQPGIEYKRQRTPSYCDRILWKSMVSAKGNLVQSSLRPVPEVSTSDHKPVVSSFTLHASPTVRSFLAPQTIIEIQDLLVKDIMASDFQGTSDPFCMFFTHPDGLLSTSRAPKTTVKKNVLPGKNAKSVGQAAAVGLAAELTRELSLKLSKSLHGSTDSLAQWGEGEVPRLQLLVSRNSLEHVSLVVGIFDHDRWSASDPLGAVTVPLRRPRTDTLEIPHTEEGDEQVGGSNGTSGAAPPYEIVVDAPIVLGHTTSGTGRLQCTLKVFDAPQRGAAGRRSLGFGALFRRQTTAGGSWDTSRYANSEVAGASRSLSAPPALSGVPEGSELSGVKIQVG